MIEFEMLPLGLRELTKFNIEYVKDGFENSDEWMWENKGISYEPDDCFCMICHSHNVVANVQYGIAPRFATCPKHIDFLTLGYQLRKDKEAV